jgi:hypothetical protein
VLSHLNFSYQQRIFMTQNWKNLCKKKKKTKVPHAEKCVCRVLKCLDY